MQPAQLSPTDLIIFFQPRSQNIPAKSEHLVPLFCSAQDQRHNFWSIIGS
jgi:hypothetical protein